MMVIVYFIVAILSLISSAMMLAAAPFKASKFNHKSGKYPLSEKEEDK
jgi:hypothetical protein